MSNDTLVEVLELVLADKVTTRLRQGLGLTRGADEEQKRNFRSSIVSTIKTLPKGPVSAWAATRS